MISLQNSFARAEIETCPFSVRLIQNGKQILSAGSGRFLADRSELPEETFLKETKLSELRYLLEYQRGKLHVTRHLQLFEHAPAIRWFDTFTAEEAMADIYYSDLAAVDFQGSQDFICMNFFSCSDLSNHRLLETRALPGKNKGGYFISPECWIYKEGPLPDCQPVKGEYDFLWAPEKNHLDMLGLGFAEIRPGEQRRANGVVIGLSADHGMQRYRMERYSAFPASSKTEILANSYPEIIGGVSEEIISKELDAAAESGVDVVFIDGGWYKDFMCDFDKDRFPNKLVKLTEKAKRLGIDIGIWMNPLGLHVGHKRNLLWDGAETHDIMLEKCPWNWMARTDDFVHAELLGSCLEKRSSFGIDLMNPECFAFRKDQIVSMYQNYGIRHFKFDLYQLSVYNTLLGDANLHYEYYRKLLEEIQQEIPELVISMDVTRRNRPNFDFGLDFGRLFIENRGRREKDHRYYQPYMALGNFWYTVKYVSGFQIELEMMPQALEYDLDYILGTTLFAAPLYWGCLVNTPVERRAEMKNFFEKMKPIREKFTRYFLDPVGDMPGKGTWSGILATAPDHSEYYLAVYRNGADSDSYRFGLPLSGTPEVLHGNAAVSSDGIVHLEGKFAFALIHGK